MIKNKLIPLSILFIVFLTFCLSGCSGKTPPALEQLSPPASWSKAIHYQKSDAYDEAAHQRPLWWEELKDSTLNSFIIEALQNNYTLALAASRLEQSRAAIGEARAARLPQAHFSGGGKRSRREALPKKEEENAGSRYGNRWQLQGTLSYEIDLLGRLSRGQQAAEKGQQAAQADLEAVTRWLISDVVVAYMDIRLADDMLTLYNMDAKLRQEGIQVHASLQKSGLGDDLTVRESQRLLDQALEKENFWRHERHLSLTRLAVLLGKAPGEVNVTPVDGYFSSLPISGRLSPNLPASVIGQRADITAAWERVSEAQLLAEKTALERFPNVTLTGDSGFISTSFHNWITHTALSWLGEAIMDFAIYDGGAKEARTKAATAERDALYAEYCQQVVQALAEVEQAVDKLLSAETSLTLATQEQERRGKDLNAVKTLMHYGKAKKTDGLEAAFFNNEAKIDVHTQRYTLITSWVYAQKSLGN